MNGSRAAVISGVYAAAVMLRCMLPGQKNQTEDPAQMMFTNHPQNDRSPRRLSLRLREATPLIEGAPSSSRRSP